MRRLKAPMRSDAPDLTRPEMAATPKAAISRDVLVWTSDAELFLPFSYILKLEGFMPSLACNLKDVLAFCARNSPCAILFDCTSEMGDAASLCCEIKRSAHAKEVHIIALFRSGTQPLHMTLLQAGVDDCLIRPLSPEKLLMSLRQISGLAQVSATQE
ncbi:hypothetical protein [Rhizobium sp. BR 314]|uniref:hypothetical protein n=1 Tax=Rhizobium sp. BR 314 TaxID=3040013 RepID=UPI0039BFE70A